MLKDIQLHRHLQRNAWWLFLLAVAIVVTFFATKAWSLEPDKKASKVSLKVAPETTTTSTTSTTTTSTTVAPTTTTKPVEPAWTPPKENVIVIPTDDIWNELRICEAGGNYGRNSGNGYYGAYQFSKATWDSMNTGYAWPHEAPPAVQDDAAIRLQARSGWGQWPACTRKLGLR